MIRNDVSETHNMQLFLIRHAQSQNNALPQAQRVEDPALTRIGHEQSRRLASQMAELQLTRIITSPFLRAMQTAEHLHEATGIAPEVRTALHEKGGCVAGARFGQMNGQPGMTRQQIAAQFPDYQIASEIDGYGWWGSAPFETLQQATRRAQRLWTDTRREFGETDQRVAYVMHGDFLLLLLACFHPQPLNLAWNTSLTRVSMAGNTATLEEYASVKHLPNYLVTW